MKNQIVLGSFFGDEGKGATVQWLCKEAIENGESVIVARFSGGAQCGHRVINNGIEHICSSFGSGVLLDVPTYLNENVYIDPISIQNEYNVLLEKTGKKPVLFINGNCRITTPFDIWANRKNKQTLDHGSCGEGIYQTFKRYTSSPVFTKNSFNLAYAVVFPRTYINEVLSYYGYSCDAEIYAEVERFITALLWIRNNTKIIPNDMILQNFVFDKYDTIVWEGSQGLLLDMDYGFMPHCTPSRTGLNGIDKKYLSDAEVFLVMRSYLTRHGNGFTPLGEQLIKDRYTLEEPTNSDTGYQGIFKVGVFDFSLLSRINDRHHLDNYKYHYNVKYNIVINHLDCLDNKGGYFRKFYYTKDGMTINTLICSSLDTSLKNLIHQEFNFDGFYVSYSQNKINRV